MSNPPFIDLSHVIEDGMVTYKGLPAPVICDYFSHEESRGRYAEGTEFQIGKIEMVSNTGTYVDVPFHRYRDGKDLSEIHLAQAAQLDAVLVDATAAHAIDEHYFKNLNVKGKAVLVRTDWSRHWRTDTYFVDHPFLTESAAIFLRDAGATLVGIDSHNIDDTAGNARPVHTILLGANILIVEHLCNLQQIPTDQAFTFSAVPPKVKGFGTFPVRAYACLTI